MMKKVKRNQGGFTLIELLIVIAIIAILAAVVFVALNPLKRFQDSRDSQRWSDVSTIIDASKVHQVDNGGSYLDVISNLDEGVAYTIGTCSSGGDTDCSAATTDSVCVDLSGLVSEGYMGSVPLDPSTGSAEKTDYYLIRKAHGILEVGACDPEGASSIVILR